MIEINGYGALTTRGLYRIDTSNQGALVLYYESGLKLPLKFKHSNSRSRAYIKLKEAIKEQESQ